MSKRKWDVAAAPTKMDSNVQSAALAVQRVAARINAKTTDGALVHTKDIAINDLKSRYLLTKASFQHQVRVDTGATVLTKGKYYPDPFLASERDPPMYLHVAATSQQALAMALAMIDHLIDNPNLPIFDSDVNEGLRGSSARIPVGILHADVLNIKTKIVGPGGSYLKHIQTVTGCKCHMRGKGSDFIEPATGKESPEEMYMYITGNSDREVNAAKKLAEDLIISVRSDINRVIPRYITSSSTEQGNSGGGYNQYAVGSGQSFIVQEHRPPAEKYVPKEQEVRPPPPPPPE